MIQIELEVYVGINLSDIFRSVAMKCFNIIFITSQNVFLNI